jgi:hypothetical protein
MTTDRYWWHSKILGELARLRDECGTNGYNVPGLASNLGMGRAEVERFAMALLADGAVEPCAPLFSEDEDWTWIRLR